MYLGDDEQSSPKYLLSLVGFIEIFLWIKVKNLQVLDFSIENLKDFTWKVRTFQKRRLFIQFFWIFTPLFVPLHPACGLTTRRCANEFGVLIGKNEALCFDLVF